MLDFHLLDGFALAVNLFGNLADLLLQRACLGFQLRELAGQYDAQLVAHLVAQFGVTFGLRRLPLQRIHLPRDFVEDVVDACQVQLGVFQSRFGQPLARLVLGDAGRLFDDGAAIGRLAAQDLADASLLDDGVGLGAKAGAHEDVLNVAQAAELAVQQVLAFAGAEQAARDLDLAGLEGPLEFAAANLQYDLWTDCDSLFVLDFRCSLGGRICIRFRRLTFFITLSRTHFFGVALDVGGAVGSQRRLVPVVGHVVLNVNFGLVDVAVNVGIDQGQRNLGHAGGLAVARAGEDDVLHVNAAQQSRRLFAQHPRNGIGDIRFAATVGADDGRNTVALKAKVGAVAERLEPEDLQLFQFQQANSLTSRRRTIELAALVSGVQTSVCNPRISLRQANFTTEKQEGQDAKHNILGPFCAKRSILHRACSICSKNYFGEE